MYTLFSLFRIGATLLLLLLSFCSLLTDLFTTLHQFSAIIFLLISKFTSFFHHLLLCLLLSFRVTLNLVSSNILFLLKSFHHFVPVLWNSLPSNLHIHSQYLTETSPFSLLFCILSSVHEVKSYLLKHSLPQLSCLPHGFF
jgi:hypothetical protein